MPLQTYSIIFEKQITPLIFHIKEECEHDDDVDEGDEGDNNKAAIHE